MTGLYKIIGNDGKEHGPMDQSTVRVMYLDGRLSKDTLVFVSFRSQWVRLADVFDVGKWSSESESERAVLKPTSAEANAAPVIKSTSADTARAHSSLEKPAKPDERCCSKCGEMIDASMVFCPFCGFTDQPRREDRTPLTTATVRPKEDFNFLPLQESKASRFWPVLIRWLLIPLSLIAADGAIGVIANSQLHPPIEQTTLWIISGIAYTSLGLAWATYFYKEDRLWRNAAIPLGLFVLFRVIASVVWGGDRIMAYVSYSLVEAVVFALALAISVVVLKFSEKYLRFTAVTDEVGAAPTEVVSILGDQPGLPKGRGEFTAICGKCGQETKTRDRRKSVTLLKLMQGETRERFSCEKCGAFIGGNPVAVVSLGLIEMVWAAYLAVFLVSIFSKPHPLSFLFVLVSFGDGLRRLFMGLVGIVRSIPRRSSA